MNAGCGAAFGADEHVQRRDHILTQGNKMYVQVLGFSQQHNCDRVVLQSAVAITSLNEVVLHFGPCDVTVSWCNVDV